MGCNRARGLVVSNAGKGRYQTAIAGEAEVNIKFLSPKEGW